MATNNIKLFDENKGNIMPDETYNANSQRLNGVQSGIASSQLQNKFQYQVSLVAYALGQIMIANGYDALDSSAVSAFVNNMSSSLLQKVVDKANQTQAQSGTDDTKYMTSAKVKLLIDYILSHNVTISGNVNFTGTVSGQSPVADNNFTTKKYVDDSIKKFNFELLWQGSINREDNIVIPAGTKLYPYTQFMVKSTAKRGFRINSDHASSGRIWTREASDYSQNNYVFVSYNGRGTYTLNNDFSSKVILSNNRGINIKQNSILVYVGSIRLELDLNGNLINNTNVFTVVNDSKNYTTFTGTFEFKLYGRNI